MPRILLDQNVPGSLGRLLSDRFSHEVLTAYDMGWSRTKDADLLAAAERANFSVFITCDQGIPYQQNLARRSIATIVLPTNRWQIVARYVSAVAVAIDAAVPGSCEELGPWKV